MVVNLHYLSCTFVKKDWIMITEENLLKLRTLAYQARPFGKGDAINTEQAERNSEFFVIALENIAEIIDEVLSKREDINNHHTVVI